MARGKKRNKKLEKSDEVKEEPVDPTLNIVNEEFSLGADVSNLTAEDVKDEENVQKEKKKVNVPRKLIKKMLSDENDDKEMTLRIWILRYKPLHNVLKKLRYSLKDKSLDKSYKKKELDELYNKL